MTAPLPAHASARMLAEAFRRTTADIRKACAVSVADTVALLETLRPTAVPMLVGFDQDGLVTVQWRTPATGLLVVVSADGALYSVRRPGGSYASDVTEFGCGDVPQGLRIAVAEVCRVVILHGTGEREC